MPLREPAGHSREELIIKRSRFICEARRIENERHASELLARKREEHPKANHVVYAFSYGDERNRQFGMSDDGEPRNTAGRPALEVLRGSDVTNVLVTIVRYFGGTKLGTGGLVHAYSDGAKLALEKLPTRVLLNEVEREVIVQYPLLDGVKIAIDEAGGRILSEEYGEKVRICLKVPRDARESLERALRDASRGSVGLE
jgi:uncharacterized YigZ family protein